jgi:deazaflavin-dependent oxidoreductase (nitroreductase family)
MTSDFESIATAESASLKPLQLAPVRPSPFVRIVMGPMTMRLNPFMLKLAGREKFHTAAQIRHVGRRSGRSFVTPVSARLSGDVAIIPLTFGNVSDWAKNIRAAGGCEIRFAGREYVASNPQFVSAAEIRPLLRTLFKGRERAMFKMLGIVQFIRLDVVPAADDQLNARADQANPQADQVHPQARQAHP